MASHKVDADAQDIKDLEYLYKPLSIPKRPMPPLKRKDLAMASKYDIFVWYERIFYPRNYMDKVVNEENAKRQKLNKQALAKYETKLSTYEVALEKYKTDSANFETTELASFREWLAQTETKFKEAKTILEKICYNKGIDKFCDIRQINFINS